MSFLTLQDIQKTYYLGKTEVPALRGLTLTINRGELVAAAGSSGCGKTTLLNIIGCVDLPSNGTYTLDNVNVGSLSEAALTQIRCKKIGYIFQNFNLIPVLSAFENVEYSLIINNTYSPKERRDLVDHYLSQVGLYEKRHHRPNQLSGGQQQRVAIARALVKKPLLVLADEPTANLDSKIAMEILTLIHKINQEEHTTFIFSSHDHKIFEHVQRVLYLLDGKIEKEEKNV